jgi:hypothetical protein
MPVYTNVAVHGTEVVTIDSVAYVADDLNLNAPSTELIQYDENGEPNGQVLIADVMTLTGTLQKAASGTVRPGHLKEFTIATGDYAGTWVVSTTGVSGGNRALKKFPFAATQKIA